LKATTDSGGTDSAGLAYIWHPRFVAYIQYKPDILVCKVGNVLVEMGISADGLPDWSVRLPPFLRACGSGVVAAKQGGISKNHTLSQSHLKRSRIVFGHSQRIIADEMIIRSGW
jgi:hypothetical protein